MEQSNSDGKRRLPVEVYFLKYAFPCTYVKLARGDISEQEYAELEKAAIEGFILARPVLERIYKNAFHYIGELAKEMGKDKWDYDVIQEYFISRHNQIIDRGEGIYEHAPEKLRDLSRVKSGVIEEVKDDVLTVSFGDKKRKVLNHLAREAKAGDKVRVHYGYAVEIV